MNEAEIKEDGKAIDANTNRTKDNQEYKLIPGRVIEKDPKVTVKENSEGSWLFVKMDKVNNPDRFIEYSIDENETNGWKQLSEEETVWYREAGATKKGEAFTYSVLTGDNVKVKEDVTKEDMEELKSGTLPKLTFTAYAVQKEGFTTADEAWDKVSAEQK